MFFSRGVAALDKETQTRTIRAIALFSDFTEYKDAYHENDCAMVTLDGYRLLWKVEYYDPTLQHNSEDSPELSKTVRVMATMIPEECLLSLAPVTSTKAFHADSQRPPKVVDTTHDSHHDLLVFTVRSGVRNRTRLRNSLSQRDANANSREP